jgi:hypothetical protein
MMVNGNHWSVLLYGNSSYMDSSKQKLQSIYGIKIIHVDPSLRVSASQVTNLEASMLICEETTSHPDIVLKFLHNNPQSAVVNLGNPDDRAVQVTYREFSRLETCGLPQVLQTLGY